MWPSSMGRTGDGRRCRDGLPCRAAPSLPTRRGDSAQGLGGGAGKAPRRELDQGAGAQGRRDAEDTSPLPREAGSPALSGPASPSWAPSWQFSSSWKWEAGQQCPGPGSEPLPVPSRPSLGLSRPALSADPSEPAAVLSTVPRRQRPGPGAGPPPRCRTPGSSSRVAQPSQPSVPCRTWSSQGALSPLPAGPAASSATPRGAHCRAGGTPDPPAAWWAARPQSAGCRC